MDVGIDEKYSYETKLEWIEKKNGIVYTSNGLKLSCSPCIEFNGEKEMLTPTDALLVAVNICIFTTFIQICDKFRIMPKSYECKVYGDIVVDENPKFIKIKILPVITINKRYQKKAKRAIFLAKKYCLVTNSLNVPLELNYNIICE